MLDVRFVPIERWPNTPTGKRSKSRFAVGYLKLLDDLEKELRAIGAKQVLIQIALDYTQIRNDGWPRSGVTPKHPGVILTFTRGGQTLSMPCDTYQTWQQNLRAISLTLHALRMINQYGVTQRDEQYKGFARLEAPSSESAKRTAAEFIAAVLGISPESVLRDPDGRRILEVA